MGTAGLVLLALTGPFLAAATGPAAAQPATPAKTTPAKTTAVKTTPTPAEGHSPQVTQALSGPLSGTGLAQKGPEKGSATTMSPAVRQATAAAATTVLNGIDVSSAQHPNNAASDINWTSVAGAGYRFAAIKATEGNYYTNPFYASDAASATAAGMYVSPYAFANPYDPASNGTAQQQADYAAASAGNYTVGGQHLPMLLDLEPDPYASQDKVNQCYGLSASDMVTWISGFMAEAAAKTGATPIIYTTANWWNTCTGNSTAFNSDVLWIAAYSAGTPGTLPVGWNTWNMWQYSSAGTVPGISVATDLDYFSGAPETVSTEAVIGAPAAPITQVRTLNSLAGQAVTYTAAGLPPGASISSGGQITGAPIDLGSYQVTVTPSASGTVVPSSISFTWYVHGTITVTSPGNQSTTDGSPVQLTVQGSDSAQSDGYAMTFSATGLPPGLSISDLGVITGWPNKPGTYTTTVTGSDSLQASSSATFTWTIGQAANSGSAGPVKVANGGTCLDDPAGGTANGTKLDIWTCNGGTNQKWTVVQDGTLRVSGHCMDVAGGGTANGTAIVLDACSASSSQWKAGPDAELINSHSGKCLDDPASKTANGTKLDLYTCNAGNNQRWTLPAGPIVSGMVGKCLADDGGSSANGTRIITWTCNATASYEQWTVASDGTIRIAGKCLDVIGGKTAAGTKIDLYACNGGSNQQWKPTLVSDLAGEIVNPHSGLCLADPADSTATGVQLQISPCGPDDPGESWSIR